MRVRTGGLIGIRRRRRFTVALATAGALVAGMMAGAPANAALVTTNCAPLSVIAARGTNVPSPDVKSRNGRVWEGAGYGPVLARLVASYKKMPAKVNAMGLVYPASGGVGYFTSVNAGVDNLVRGVNWIARECSSSSRIVLLGHSQGAQVVLDALSSGRMTATALLRIKAAAVFGDPTHGPKRKINAPGNPEAYGIFSRAKSSREWLDNYKTPGNLGGKHKIRSWCYPKDAICNGGLGTDMETHSSYLNTSARRNAALNWIGALP